MRKVLTAVFMFIPIVIFAISITIVDGIFSIVEFVSESIKEILNDTI